jgi:PTS system nitrogen regulatory IIA component
MLLNVNDAANALHVNGKSILSFIRKDRLPATLVNGEYMINRSELLEWATERRMEVDPSIFRITDDDHVNLPTLCEAIEAGGIHYGVKGTDKESILRQVVANLGLPAHVDPEFLLQVLLTREELGTTAIGDGIAIPHVRNPILLQIPVSMISLSFLEKPVDFAAPDGKPVDVLFTLTSPTVKVHLHLLSVLSFALRDQSLKNALKKKEKPEALMTLFRTLTQGKEGGL